MKFRKKNAVSIYGFACLLSFSHGHTDIDLMIQSSLLAAGELCIIQP